jgi:hypothetical protein
MRPLSCKQIAAALGVQEAKASQAMTPALAKVAACMLLYPAETWAEINEAMRVLVRQRENDSGCPGACSVNPTRRPF